MGEILTVFVPFGDWVPDASEFQNEGLQECTGVAPFGDTYLPVSNWEIPGDNVPAAPKGAWVHPTISGGEGYLTYVGTQTKLYEYSSPGFVRTDKSRTVGGNYAATASRSGWQGASFGDAVIMTDLFDDPQLLTSPAAANFVKLATTAGGTAGSGMDPQARIVFPVRGNLFLAYLILPSALLRPDGTTELAAGTYPTHVCCSATDNVRAYGSSTATPNLIGTMLQPLNFDLGYITGGIGGQYGLVSCQRGWVRIDGPPYTFRPISDGAGCVYPNSIVRLGEDVYFFGPSGPMVLRGGDGRAVDISRGRVSRALLDRVMTQVGFIPDSTSVHPSEPRMFLSAAADAVNNLVWWNFIPSTVNTGPAFPSTTLIYDATNDRFSLGGPPNADGSAPDAGVHFLCQAPQSDAATRFFAPGRDLVGIYIDQAGAASPAQPVQALSLSTIRFSTDFRRFNDKKTTRIVSVRPIISQWDAQPIGASVYVTDKNKSYDVTAPTGPYTTLDTHGAIPTTGTTYSDFHKIRVIATPVSMLVREISGVEIKYMEGGVYSA